MTVMYSGSYLYIVIKILHNRFILLVLPVMVHRPWRNIYWLADDIHVCLTYKPGKYCIFVYVIDKRLLASTQQHMYSGWHFSSKLLFWELLKEIRFHER